MSRQWPFERSNLIAAIKATFIARSTDIPFELTGLSQDYVQSHLVMWTNYLKKNGLTAESLDAVTTRLRTFLLPCLKQTTGNSRWNHQQARWE